MFIYFVFPIFGHFVSAWPNKLELKTIYKHGKNAVLSSSDSVYLCDYDSFKNL